jgi:hypothetical protein
MRPWLVVLRHKYDPNYALPHSSFDTEEEARRRKEALEAQSDDRMPMQWHVQPAPARGG